MKNIHIFLASSNDMIKFRNCTEQVIDELNQSLAPHFDVRLQLFRWEKSVTPQLGRPQQIIFEQSNFGQIDIFIGILGNRFGTPTGACNAEMIEYESGTQEEYDMACRLFQQFGRPNILIFKNSAPLKPGTFDIEQYAKVQKFIQDFEASGSHPGVYSQFKTANDFQSQLRIALTKNILNLVAKPDSQTQESVSHFSESYQNSGYLQMFVSETNNLRSLSKNAAISGSKSIELMAKTGNSFLGSIGNRYMDLLIQNIQKNDTHIRIMLMNPWSESALLSAFGESASEEEYLACLLHTKPSQDILTAYMQTSWYQMKLQDVLSSYRQICTQYPNIELRFVDVEIPASVLLTDKYCYFEPYANYCKTDRLRKKVSTFEVELSCESELYQASKQYFDLLWSTAIPYSRFIQEEPIYKTLLANRLDAMYGRGTTYFIGVHALVRRGDSVLLLHRSDKKAYMPGKWDIPGGSLESGESTVETILREVREETGLQIKVNKIRYAYSNKVELPARQTIQIVYEAEYVSGDVRLNPAEHQEYRWVDIRQMKDYDLINFVRDMLENEEQ